MSSTVPRREGSIPRVYRFFSVEDNRCEMLLPSASLMTQSFLYRFVKKCMFTLLHHNIVVVLAEKHSTYEATESNYCSILPTLFTLIGSKLFRLLLSQMEALGKPEIDPGAFCMQNICSITKL